MICIQQNELLFSLKSDFVIFHNLLKTIEVLFHLFQTNFIENNLIISGPTKFFLAEPTKKWVLVNFI